MKRKVIYLCATQLSEKVEHELHIDYLCAKNVAVEYWNVLPLLYGNVHEYGAKNASFQKTPRSFKEIEAMLRSPANWEAIYVVGITYGWRSVNIYRLLSKHRAFIVYLEYCTFPGANSGRWNQVLHGIFSSPIKLTNRILGRIGAAAYKKFNLIKPFDIFFAAGQESVLSNQHNALKVVPTNSVDYLRYTKSKSIENRVVTGRYAVFLDIYLPFHADQEVCNLQTIAPSIYYDSINRFFELLELHYGVKVIIAAHPTADYSNNPFNGREIYQGLTAELVKDADFIISHHSASISYAVLNRKPVVIIYTNEMLRLYDHTVVMRLHRSLASYLDAALYNIDEITRGNQIIIREINQEYYNSFKYNYLTTRESEHTSAQEIFWREICASRGGFEISDSPISGSLAQPKP